MLQWVAWNFNHFFRANVYSPAPGLGAQFNMVNVDADALMSLARPRFMYLWSGR
jgi:hypothetical protein